MTGFPGGGLDDTGSVTPTLHIRTNRSTPRAETSGGLPTFANRPV